MKITYDIHPAATLFPMMDDEAFAALKKDIAENGLRESIVFWKNKLVDGRNRAKACEELGIEPGESELDENQDPVAYVISANLHRRHLSASQRSQVAARARDYYAQQAKERQKKHGGTAPGKKKNTPGKFTGSDARDAAGKALGVSGKMVDMATKVLDKGTPELISIVEQGNMAMSRAVKIADLPAEQQAAAIEEQINGNATPKSRGTRKRQQPEKTPAADLNRRIEFVEADLLELLFSWQSGLDDNLDDYSEVCVEITTRMMQTPEWDSSRNAEILESIRKLNRLLKAFRYCITLAENRDSHRDDAGGAEE